MSLRKTHVLKAWSPTQCSEVWFWASDWITCSLTSLVGLRHWWTHTGRQQKLKGGVWLEEVSHWGCAFERCLPCSVHVSSCCEVICFLYCALLPGCSIVPQPRSPRAKGPRGWGCWDHDPDWSPIKLFCLIQVFYHKDQKWRIPGTQQKQLHGASGQMGQKQPPPAPPTGPMNNIDWSITCAWDREGESIDLRGSFYGVISELVRSKNENVSVFS